MPYYRKKILKSRSEYQKLICYESSSSPFKWHPGFCLDFSFLESNIERQFRVCTASEKRWSAQLATFLYLILSIIWVLYFGISLALEEKDADRVALRYSIYASVAVVSAFLGLLLISFFIGYHYSITLSSFFIHLIGYIAPVSLLIINENYIHVAQIAFLWCCPILINYCLLDLPLLVLGLSSLVYSLALPIFIGLNTKDDATFSTIWTVFVAILVNVISIIARFYEEFSARRVFYRMGRSLLSRQQSLEETLLKEQMIKSVMPPGVCNEILHSGMLHDVVVKKSIENNMRNLPIKQMENVSILFADLVGFTAMSSHLKASELVTLLTDLYGRYDCVAEAYNCENISILGDCYFAVSGCPEPDSRHADNCMYTGVGLIKATRDFKMQKNKCVDIRVGIHTGIVLCGIVGGTKFKYDVWSNDAKLANAMESGGVPGRVHLSETTKKFLVDNWELEEGYGSHRDSDLQGIKTYLVKEDFQESLIIKSKHKDLSDSMVYQTIERKRGSSITSKEFDGTVLLQYLLSSEEINTGYFLLPVLHPGIALDNTKQVGGDKNGILTTNAPSTNPVLSNQIHPVQNGTKVLPGKHHPSKTEIIVAASRPWRIFNVFRKRKIIDERDDDSSTDLLHNEPILHPLFVDFTSRPKYRDFQRHGWEERCECLYSKSYSFISIFTIFIFSIMFSLLVIINLNQIYSDKQCGTEDPACSSFSKNWLAIVVIEVVVTVVILFVSSIFFVRWRAERDSILTPIHRIPYDLLTTSITISVMVSTFLTFVFTTDEDWSTKQALLLPSILALVHCLLFDKTRLMVTVTLTTVSEVILIILQIYTGQLKDTTFRNRSLYFGIMTSVCLYIVVLVLTWIRTVKNKVRFATLLECNDELEIMKQEEDVTTQLFNTIIPIHVSEHFLTELRYSHSYEHVGVIFASITNFWDFYEEKFQGGVGCIRVLNEIIRDLDDMLSTKNTDPRWKAIQKIKTVGACYMAASGLDPVTEAQTRQGNHEHIVNLMDFCFEILDIIKQFNNFTFGTDFTMKIGFSYGPVTDGIIGQNKVLYDIWGDTVNLSSRMMSTGVVGRIQLPSNVVPHLEDHFKCPKRGKVAIKGKGTMITHFCVGKHSPEQISQNLGARAAKNMNTV